MKKNNQTQSSTNTASNIPTPPAVNADPENIQGDLIPIISANNTPAEENLDDGTLMEVKNFVIKVDLKKDKLLSKNG